MANVWGPKADGRTGAMTEADIKAFVLTKCNWRDSPNLSKAISKGANYMFNHKGKGGGTSLTHNGKTIFHTTEGGGECTFFFTCADGLVASIIGIGEHAGKSGQTHTYRLVWQTPGWVTTTKVITT